MQDVREHSLGTRLERLLQYLRDQANLDDSGTSAALETISDLLARRAQLLADHARHPEIGREVIERPIIVTGCPRSGTTLLNMLIGQHPDNRIPQWWETTRPSPPPALSTASDGRLADADQDIAELLRVDPSLLLSHPYFDEGGRTAAECESLGALDLRVIRRTIYFRVPAFIALDLMDNAVEFYEFHKKVLQQLQWRMPRRRWALKGVEHHVRLEALKTVYPDAAIVWVHRDPQKIFPSVFELNARLIEGTLGRTVDRPTLGAKLMEIYGGMLDRAAASPLIDHPDIYHLRYTDFAADPIGQIRDIYNRFRLPFGPAAERAIQDWLDAPANKGDRHGKFTYSLDDFGITPQTLEQRFAAYRAKFAIPFENA